ncbi:hypothetical protein SCOCK_60105 [Actinacidiphila cocklensis]|uniref:Uncharacterized protein n=1 Tax=Actinacidiphila cocklensis TaxID=887465 RepID=A0A9W4DXF6_9ACTN|nr:hypothetical protein SCOCK_60105 [Actinacidiphila cocklensis]
MTSRPWSGAGKPSMRASSALRDRCRGRNGGGRGRAHPFGGHRWPAARPGARLVGGAEAPWKGASPDGQVPDPGLLHRRGHEGAAQGGRHGAPQGRGGSGRRAGRHRRGDVLLLRRRRHRAHRRPPRRGLHGRGEHDGHRERRPADQGHSPADRRGDRRGDPQAGRVPAAEGLTGGLSGRPTSMSGPLPAR